MPVHDWTLVDAGIFHHFHVGWIPALAASFNGGLLPKGYYALAEQHAGESIPDVLTLHASRPGAVPLPPPPDTGGILLAEAPPRVRHQETVEPASLLARRRTVAVRHVSGHRLVALVEIMSPGNKDRAAHVNQFADKVAEAVELGVHVLVIDLFPPGRHDPRGIHAVIRQRLEQLDEPFQGEDDLVPGEPLSLVSYAAGSPVRVYREHAAVGGVLPEMPLFLRPDRYVNVPLAATYDDAYRGVPAVWRDVIEGRSPAP